MTRLVLELPDFASMSDDEVQQHVLARTKDGRWSAQTRWLLSEFGTDKLDLNEAWAQTSVDWVCPCCRRHKVNLARVTESGVLLCQLDWHHDHLADAAGEVMRRAITTGIDDDLLIWRKRICSAAMPLIERFGRVLICNDCNAADAAMKARLGADVPRAFSFTVREIATFILPASNQSHRFDEEKAWAIWPSAKAQFEERMAFAQMMGDRIAAGRHDLEPHSLADPNRHYEEPWILHTLAHSGADPRNRPDNIGEALLARSRSTSGRSMTGAKKRMTKVRIPTAEEFRRMDEANSQTSPPWRNVPADWQCPACNRSKFEIMRISNKGNWLAAIMMLNEYRAETNSLSLARRDRGDDLPVVLSDYRQIGVCHDCRQIVTDAMSARPGVDQESIRISDLAALTLEAVPHVRHDIGRETILKLVDANAGWLKAVKDFWAHREEAKGVHFDRYRLMRNTGMSCEDARAALLPQLVAAGRLPESEAGLWFDWLIDEADRLSDR